MSHNPVKLKSTVLSDEIGLNLSSDGNLVHIPDGLYRVRNHNLNPDDNNRSLTYNNSYYSQCLSGDNWYSFYNINISNYIENGKFRRDIVWNIRRNENGYYTIKNYGLLKEPENNKSVFGFLNLRKNAVSAKGYYVGVLTYHQDCYLPTASSENNILWEINRAENGYIIQNRGIKSKYDDHKSIFSSTNVEKNFYETVGGLCMTNYSSASGYFVQVLEKDKYDIDNYIKGATLRNNILWELLPINRENNALTFTSHTSKL